MADANKPILDIQSLGKSYGRTEVLKNIDVSMGDGEFLVLVGPSGSGKSTLLSCIAGLTDVTGGSIMIDGRDMTRVKPSERNIAMVFQSYALFPTMTVEGNITFGMRVRRVDKAEQARRVQRVAEMLKIDHLLDRKPAQLSGGQRQRVAMARALVRNPKLFLFDEPLSNLDAKLRVSMRSEIKRLHRTMNASIVYVTHDQIEAMTLATRIALLNNGILQQIGTPKELYNTPANTFVADFMGSPPMNLIPATVHAEQGGVRIAIERDNGDKVVLFDTTPPAALAGMNGKTVTFGIRPEAMIDATENVPAHFQTMTHTVDMVDPAGADTFAIMQLGGRDVTARLHGDSNLEPGGTHSFALDLTHVSYFDPESGLRLA